MKKIPLYLMMMMMSLSIFPSTIFAAEKNTTAVTATTKEMPAEVR